MSDTPWPITVMLVLELHPFLGLFVSDSATKVNVNGGNKALGCTDATWLDSVAISQFHNAEGFEEPNRPQTSCEAQLQVRAGKALLVRGRHPEQCIQAYRVGRDRCKGSDTGRYY